MDSILRPREVAARLGISRVTLYRKRAADTTFPLPVDTGAGKLGYRESELQAWIDSRPRVGEHLRKAAA